MKHYDELLEELEKWGISSSRCPVRFKAKPQGEWSMQRALREQQDFLAKHGANLDEVTRQMTAVNIFNIAANPEHAHKGRAEDARSGDQSSPNSNRPTAASLL